MSSNNATPGDNIVWDENGQPLSIQFDDVYFSKEHGLNESRFVFLEGNNLKQRFTQLAEAQVFRIAETGFGTGLNFLSVWQLWEQSQTAEHDKTAEKKNARLEFISVEKYPLTKEALKKSLSLWPELKPYVEKLLESYPPQPWNGLFTTELIGPSGLSVRLSIYFDALEAALVSLSPCPLQSSEALRQKASFGEYSEKIDAWFLDGFAPSKNPEMWTSSLFAHMRLNSHDHTTFSTFTSAGLVRRGLEKAGFRCEKTPGFGRKREMLTGRVAPKTTEAKETIKKSETYEKPEDFPSPKSPLAQSDLPTWILKEHRPRNNKISSAIVIGAGLAGAQLSFALARRGIAVTVLEKQTVASGASSNFQGAVYTRLSASDDALSNFNKHSQLYADNFYKTHQLFEQCGSACGVLHLCATEREQQRLTAFSQQFSSNGKFELLNKKAASEAANLKLNHSALHIKNSGWLHPKKLCEILLAHKNINVIEHQQVDHIEKVGEQWLALSNRDSNPTKYSADVCIICTARDALTLQQSAHLPIKSIRGQVSHCQTNPKLKQLSKVICGEGYLCPSAEWEGESLHSLGATFNLNDNSIELNHSDHQQNLSSLNQIFSQTEIAEHTRIADGFSGKVGFRTTSPDYFPIVGPLPKLDTFRERFVKLSKKANARIDKCGDYYEGLYCSLAFGSRGLAYTPLASALLADLICGSFLPVDRSIYSHLNPARFFIRSLIKNKSYGESDLVDKPKAT